MVKYQRDVIKRGTIIIVIADHRSIDSRVQTRFNLRKQSKYKKYWTNFFVCKIAFAVSCISNKIMKNC